MQQGPQTNGSHTHTPARQPPEDPSLVRFHFDIMESICGFIHGGKKGEHSSCGDTCKALHTPPVLFTGRGCSATHRDGMVVPTTTQQDQRWNPHAEAPTCPLLPFPFFPLWNFPFHLLNATCKEAAWCVSIRNVLNGTLYKLASPTFWSHQMPRLPVIMRHSSLDICGGAGSP